MEEILWYDIYTSKLQGQTKVVRLYTIKHVILTNIGVNPRVLINGSAEKQRALMKIEAIIECHHMRESNELPHRG